MFLDGEEGKGGKQCKNTHVFVRRKQCFILLVVFLNNKSEKEPLPKGISQKKGNGKGKGKGQGKKEREGEGKVKMKGKGKRKCKGKGKGEGKRIGKGNENPKEVLSHARPLKVRAFCLRSGAC